MSKDLSSAGPGSPLSLRKILESETDVRRFTVLVDGTPERVGVVCDDPGTVSVLVSEREEQAQYFLSLGLPMPPYLRKYLGVVYPDADLDAMYANAKSNKATRQVIGMIQIMGGALNLARKAGKGIRLYVEEPETFLHPTQQSRMVELILALERDYGPPAPPETAVVE